MDLLVAARCCLCAILFFPPFLAATCAQKKKEPQLEAYAYLPPTFTTCLKVVMLVVSLYGVIAFMWPMLGGMVLQRTASMHLEELVELLKQALLLAFIGNIEHRLVRNPTHFVMTVLHGAVFFPILFQLSPSGSFTFVLHEG
jgi:hypothetical protein